MDTILKKQNISYSEKDIDKLKKEIENIKKINKQLISKNIDPILKEIILRQQKEINKQKKK